MKRVLVRILLSLNGLLATLVYAECFASQPRSEKPDCAAALTRLPPDDISGFHLLEDPPTLHFSLRDLLQASLTNPTESSAEKYELFFQQSRLREIDKKLLKIETLAGLLQRFRLNFHPGSQLWEKRQLTLGFIEEIEWRLGQRLLSEEVKKVVQEPAAEYFRTRFSLSNQVPVQCSTPQAPFYFQNGRRSELLPLVRQNESQKLEFETFPLMMMVSCRQEGLDESSPSITPSPWVLLKGVWREDAQLLILGARLFQP